MIKTKDKVAETISAYLLLLPVFILWSLWFFYPVLQSFLLSFQKFNYLTPAFNRFVGFDNYLKLFDDPYFYKALINTLILVCVVVPLQSIAALVLAVLINQKFKLRGFFRTSYYLPYVISPVAVATVFMYFFVQNTVITRFFNYFGLANTTWYADMKLALPFIAIVYVWQQIGFYMVVYLAGLQIIPEEIYESGSIDGANKFQKFFQITLPMLKPVTFLVLTYSMIQAFQMFDQVAAVSQRSGPLGSPAGATSTLVTYFYLHAFRYREMGYGSAAAIILFLMILMVTLIQKKFVGDEE